MASQSRGRERQRGARGRHHEGDYTPHPSATPRGHSDQPNPRPRTSNLVPDPQSPQRDLTRSPRPEEAHQQGAALSSTRVADESGTRELSSRNLNLALSFHVAKTDRILESIGSNPSISEAIEVKGQLRGQFQPHNPLRSQSKVVAHRDLIPTPTNDLGINIDTEENMCSGTAHKAPTPERTSDANITTRTRRGSSRVRIAVNSSQEDEQESRIPCFAARGAFRRESGQREPPDGGEEITL